MSKQKYSYTSGGNNAQLPPGEGCWYFLSDRPQTKDVCRGDSPLHRHYIAPTSPLRIFV